jgi:hypothetical protein
MTHIISFLDSLIFNDSIGAYIPLMLFAIFCLIVVLIAGVVLLTQKKSEPKGLTGGKLDAAPGLRPRRGERKGKGADLVNGGDGADDEGVDSEGSHALRDMDLEAGGSTTRLAWTLGGASDDEDDDDVRSRPHSPAPPPRVFEHANASHEEGHLMAGADDDERPPHPHTERTHARVNPAESDETLANRAQDDEDEFGGWKDAGLSSEDGDRNGHGNGPSRM